MKAVVIEDESRSASQIVSNDESSHAKLRKELDEGQHDEHKHEHDHEHEHDQKQ